MLIEFLQMRYVSSRIRRILSIVWEKLCIIINWKFIVVDFFNRKWRVQIEWLQLDTIVSVTNSLHNTHICILYIYRSIARFKDDVKFKEFQNNYSINYFYHFAKRIYLFYIFIYFFLFFLLMIKRIWFVINKKLMRSLLTFIWCFDK